jgi:hypothetical protein
MAPYREEGPMGTQSYYNQLAQMSLAQLQAELQTEIQALSELLAAEHYDDRNRQISETRENIRVIKKYIADQ